VIVLCHGGPIAEPADARYVLERTTGVAGFFGASSMERLPTETAITDRVREFKSIGSLGSPSSSPQTGSPDSHDG
jgi:predicted TIM-barrel enzyme